MLWRVIHTHIATERMLTKDICDHHIVTGNYAKWLVNNSGKKNPTSYRILRMMKTLERRGNLMTIGYLSL